LPKIAGRVLASKLVDGKFLAKIALNGRLLPEGVNISIKWGKSRSLPQNALMWLFLGYLFNDCGLKDEYATVDELHETLKATFLSKRVFHGGHEFIHVGSTTTLGKIEFGEYLDKINRAMIDFHGIDTGPFWQEYKDHKDGISKDMLELSDEGKAAQARGEF
jgi:hypothetical protein